MSLTASSGNQLRQRSSREEALSQPLEKRPNVPSGTSRAAHNARPQMYGGKTGRHLRNIFLLAASIVVAYFLWLKVYTGYELVDAYLLCSSEGPFIYTVNQNNARAQCLFVKGAQVLGFGSLEDLKNKHTSRQHASIQIPWLTHVSQNQIRTIFVPKGAIVVPGLADSHAHVLEYGASQLLHLEKFSDIQSCIKHVRDHVLSDSGLVGDRQRFIEGWGWDHTSWPVQTWPSASDLEADPVLQGRRISLRSKDGHALWVSAKVLEEISPFPDSVDGGIIVRDGDGQPTGVLLDSAQDLIKRVPLTEADLTKRFMIAVNDALSVGLTFVHDAGFDPTSLAFYKRQAEQRKLPIRIYGMQYFNESMQYWGKEEGKYDNGRLIARSVKMFADGALRTAGAALHEPYTDHSHTRGFMRLEAEVMRDWIPKFLRDGWQVNVHAIGDRANAIVLDAFEEALKDADVSTLRPRLEHAQLLTERDIQRLGQLGIIASVQPTHAISDMWYAEDRLGPNRIKDLYAFRSILDAGARIALGSDFPVEDMNPLVGFYAAVTRLSPDGQSPHGPDGWFPEERLTREEALRGMTIDAAYASFTDSMLGSLEPGKRADCVVLSRDIMTIPASQILTTKVLATIIDGEVVYGAI